MTNNTHKTLQEQIIDKKDEIVKYEGVLQRYESGRWMDMGMRHYRSLKGELKDLESKLVDIQVQEDLVG